MWAVFLKRDDGAAEKQAQASSIFCRYKTSAKIAFQLLGNSFGLSVY
jgi:hypothetical protein